MDKKQILKTAFFILAVGATLTTTGYILKYNICPKIKILESKENEKVRIKWAGKEYTVDKLTNASYLKWTAKLEDGKINVYNSKEKLIKTYSVARELNSFIKL